jgi:hypothetical protein
VIVDQWPAEGAGWAMQATQAFSVPSRKSSKNFDEEVVPVVLQQICCWQLLEQKAEAPL